MASTLEITKSLLSPPGGTIQETIEEMGMSQAELAERMGRPKEKINDIIKGKEPVTTATAFKLEKVLGIPASFWLNREKAYRTKIYELQQQNELEKKKDWLQKFPIKDIRKLGWLPDTKETYLLVNALLQFFGIASPEEWERIYVDKEISVAFRISLANTQSPHAISAWLRMGELQSQTLTLSEFDKKKFKETLTEIKDLAYLMPLNFAAELQNICSRSGVAVVYTPALPQAPISGASRWFHNRPIIQLSGRFRTNDHFWFTFFHEAAHIILHGKKDIFLENVEGTENDQEKENDANVFAAKILIDPKDWRTILESRPLTLDKIKNYAAQMRVDPGIIVGRLQHEKKIPQSFGNELKKKIDIFSV
ncbi:MAG: HigA family addiction module antitoxin [Bacteroidia bacterium]